MNLDLENLSSDVLQENSSDSAKKSSYYNPFKSVLKTAATGKDR
jgi:hypothetical protein